MPCEDCKDEVRGLENDLYDAEHQRDKALAELESLQKSHDALYAALDELATDLAVAASTAAKAL